MWPAYLVCGGWHVACLLSMCGWSGPPRSQGCGPVMGSSGSPGWLLAFGLVMFLVRGVVEGLGGGRGPGVSTIMLGATVGVLTPAGAGLGVFDAGAVSDLGLPRSAADLGLVDPVRVDGAVAVEPVPIGGEPQKFSMGVTLPTVPARLVKRILAGEFVDMGELSQEALRAEFRCPGEGEDQKSSKAKFRPVADRDAWVAGFAQYAGVVCRTHPGKAVALWGHLAVMMSCPTRLTAGWWRNYDLSLRHGYSSAEEADFALNQCLYTQAMVESSEALQRPAPPAVLPLAPPRAKKRKVQACFAWNNGRACASMPCTAAHGAVASTPGDSVLLRWRDHLETLPARACDLHLLVGVCDSP